MVTKIINKPLTAALVFALIALGNAGSTLYLPALINIGHDLHASNGEMQITLACYLISFGVSQFFYGPLSDAFGRKVVLLSGCAIFMVGSILSAVSTNVDCFIVGRLIEGLGIGSANTVGYAIIRDIYKGDQLSKIMSYASVFVGLTPILAPLIGGYLVEYIDWQACFWFLFLVAVILFMLSHFKLLETNQHLNSKACSPREMMKNYFQLLSSGAYLGNVLCTSFAFSALIAINTMLPFLTTEQFHLTPSVYGIVTIFTGCGYFSGAYLSGILSIKFGRLQTIFIGCTIQFVILILSFLHGFEDLSLVTIVATFALFLHGVGMIVPTGTGGSMEPFPQIAGSEAAMLGVIMYSISALFTAICSHVSKNSSEGTIILLCVITCLTILSACIVKKSKA